MDRWKRLASAYLCLQSAATLLWWAAMIARPEWRPHFFAGDSARELWKAFLVPDLLLFAGAGAAAGWGLHRGRSWAGAMMAAHAASAAYATLLCTGASILTGTAWPGALLMLAACIPIAAISLRWRRACTEPGGPASDGREGR